MADRSKRKRLIFTFISMLNQLTTVATFNLMIAVVSASLNRLHMAKLHFIVDSTSKRLQTISGTVKRLERQGKRRRFWQRPGRTSAWWSNFVKSRVVPEE